MKLIIPDHCSQELNSMIYDSPAKQMLKNKHVVHKASQSF